MRACHLLYLGTRGAPPSQKCSRSSMRVSLPCLILLLCGTQHVRMPEIPPESSPMCSRFDSMTPGWTHLQSHQAGLVPAQKKSKPIAILMTWATCCSLAHGEHNETAQELTLWHGIMCDPKQNTWIHHCWLPIRTLLACSAADESVFMQS